MKREAVLLLIKQSRNIRARASVLELTVYDV